MKAVLKKQINTVLKDTLGLKIVRAEAAKNSCTTIGSAATAAMLRTGASLKRGRLIPCLRKGPAA